MTIRPLIVIPARLAATRLPQKPMAMIGDVPMIVHVWRRAVEAAIAPVIVACDAPEIATAVSAAGGKAVLTDPHHPSGSDRVWEAVQRFDAKGEYNVIINLQGDLPTLDPALLPVLLAALATPNTDIATLAAPINREEEHTNSSVVKAIIAQSGRALYFTRTSAPYGDGPRYHHIGIYAYTRAALEKFVALPPSPLEVREKLEQLRALENGLQIAVAVVDTVPLGVDTPDDLERAREILCR
ncbi:MAG: 3-deoxy-manno-octulosonate cytidylyltransferase [Rickettsiales bacterium]